ncbi:MAG: hypothetical protein AAFO77_14635 [Pseudomonadota bacterium]
MGLLAGCQTTTALVAGQQTNTADTALIGALNGGLIGQLNAVSLDGSGTRQALVSEYRALEYAAPGDLVTWQLPQQSLSGQVVASQPYRVGSQDCRQYTHQVFNVALPAATSAPATARGTACRNPDGSWTLLT